MLPLSKLATQSRVEIHKQLLNSIHLNCIKLLEFWKQFPLAAGNLWKKPQSRQTMRSLWTPSLYNPVHLIWFTRPLRFLLSLILSRQFSVKYWLCSHSLINKFPCSLLLSGLSHYLEPLMLFYTLDSLYNQCYVMRWWTLQYTKILSFLNIQTLIVSFWRI